jgi:protein SCO1
MRTLIACVAVCYVALISFNALTEGFNVVTSEDARKLAVHRTPQTLPPFALLDAFSQSFNLQNATRTNRKVVILDFFFSRCNSVCLGLGGQFQRLQDQIIARGLQDKITLLSVSFDPAHDSPEALQVYAQRMHADSTVWRFAAPVSRKDLVLALNAFDVVVIPDKLAIFQHNAAIHVINSDAKLARIIAYDEVDTSLEVALSLYSKSDATGP